MHSYDETNAIVKFYAYMSCTHKTRVILRDYNKLITITFIYLLMFELYLHEPNTGDAFQ